MKVLFDASGENYTVMRVQAPVGHMLQYTILPEHNGVPADLVHYMQGVLTRVGPDGVVEGDHEPGKPVPVFTKTGAYTFVVREEAIWDCISMWGGEEGKRLVAEVGTDTALVEGDVFIAEGEWNIGSKTYSAPCHLKGLLITPAFPQGSGVLFYNIRTEPLENTA